MLRFLKPFVFIIVSGSVFLVTVNYFLPDPSPNEQTRTIVSPLVVAKPQKLPPQIKSTVRFQREKADPVLTVTELLAEIEGSELTETQKYSVCLSLSSQQNYPEALSSRIEAGLLTCRIIRNRLGLTDASVAQWQSMRELLVKQGWEAVIDAINEGKFPADISLQFGEPKHDLFLAFAAERVDDVRAYHALTNLGLMPNSKFLSAILAGRMLNLLPFYVQHTDIYGVNDMQYNAATMAAKYSKGDLEAVGYLLALGVPYEDKLGRTVLTELFKRGSYSVNSQELLEIIDNYEIPVTNQTINDAKQANLPEHAIQELIRRADSSEG